MPLDAKLAALVDELVAHGLPNPAKLNISEGRAATLGFLQMQQDDGPALREVRDLLAPGPDGSIPVRIYIPEAAPAPAPVLVYFHGGGWVMGDIAVADQACRDLANTVGCVVVSAEYRRSPETKFPGPVEDCYAVTTWVAENSSSLGIDPRAIGVCGDSAGGNLATCVALMARDRGTPTLVFQALIYPVVGAGISPTIDRSHSANPAVQPERVVLQTDWYRNLYLRTDDDLTNPYAVPLAATDLHGLPPTLIVGCEHDRLVAEETEYADRLRAAGTPVTMEVYAGEVHGFFWMNAQLRPNYTRLLEQISREFHQVLDRATSS